MSVKEKIKGFIEKLNQNGIPLPILQDVVTKKPSITYTFFVIAGVLTLLATFESTRSFTNINFDEIKEFFDMCAYIYVGRSAIKMIGATNPKEEKGE